MAMTAIPCFVEFRITGSIGPGSRVRQIELTVLVSLMG